MSCLCRDDQLLSCLRRPMDPQLMKKPFLGGEVHLGFPTDHFPSLCQNC